MEELLRRLLNRLEQVGNNHEELYDSECRQRMGNAVMNGFVRNTRDFTLADKFGLHSAAANHAVQEALGEFIADARQRATELGLNAFHDRLNAFQNSSVQSDEEGGFFDDFFGYSAPENFDSAGNVIGRV